MPRMIPAGDSMEKFTIPGPGTFGFSGLRPEKLEAAEYTLATIVVDETGSVAGFTDELLTAVKSIVKACAGHPRTDNLLIRLISFNEKVTEIHGFKPLSGLNADDYEPFNPKGMTALYDAVYSAVGATLTYAGVLTDQDFSVNAAVYIITDGMDNRSTVTPKMIAKKVTAAIKGEEIETMLTVLIGLDDPGEHNGSNVDRFLQDFKDQARLTEYIDAGGATPQVLAKLARFVSQSISAQSMLLGSGAASRSLAF